MIFGRNDLVQDAPISRIDLLACRNALMYFNAETQARIVSRLGFALKPDGVLFLGKAEMLLNHTDAVRAVRPETAVLSQAGSGPTGRELGGETAGDGGRLRRSTVTDLAALRTEAFLTSPVAQLVVGADDTFGWSTIEPAPC